MTGNRGTRRGDLAAIVVMILAALAISVVRPRIAERFHRLRITADVYPLPPPEQTVIASLGYRSALADAIFAHVLVSYGLHFQEKRRFEFMGEYLDTVNALDPIFRDPYRFADTLLVLSPEPARLEHYVKAREVVLRGLQNRPYDTELWLTAGQFLAYLARPYVPPKMAEEWSSEGAKILSRACELVSKNDNIPYHCITAAQLLANAGEREAAIESLKRLLSVTDDPEIERIALGYLKQKLSDREQEQQKRRIETFRKAWKSDLPFVSKDMMLVLGPKTDTARCAGGHDEDLSCSSTWRNYMQRALPVGE